MQSMMQVRMPGVLMGAAAKTLLAVAIVSMAVGYYFQMSSLTTGGYEISKLEHRKAQLLEENDALRNEVASYQSMTSVQKRLESSGMVKATDIKYLKVQDGSVAQR
jgi:cell division protein FtsL